MRTDDPHDGKPPRDQDIDAVTTEASRIAFIVVMIPPELSLQTGATGATPG